MRTRNIDLGLLIFRILFGFLMLLHGIGKLNGGLEFVQGVLTQKGLPAFIAYGVLVGEIVAPVMILVGYRTRIAAVVFAFNCLVALLLMHTGDILKLNENGGWQLELLGLYLFGAVALFFTGAGSFALSRKNIWD